MLMGFIQPVHAVYIVAPCIPQIYMLTICHFKQKRDQQKEKSVFASGVPIPKDKLPSIICPSMASQLELSWRQK